MSSFVAGINVEVGEVVDSDNIIFVLTCWLGDLVKSLDVLDLDRSLDFLDLIWPFHQAHFDPSIRGRILCTAPVGHGKVNP